MKKILCLVLCVAMLALPVVSTAEESVAVSKVEVNYDMTVTPSCNAEAIEVGDQFLVSFELADVKPYLTFQVKGSFDNKLAEVVAPVYSNKVLGVVENSFSNEDGSFTFVAYDQTIRGTEENVLCSILFVAKEEGSFKIELTDETMVGKADENAFYVLDINNAQLEIGEDSDNEYVSIIKEPEPLTPYDDMFGYDWAEKAVGVMYNLGALENIADTSYYPAQNITRGEFITMLVKVCKLKSSAEVQPFGDVSEEGYQYACINIARALGIANGDENGNFRPDENITRQDIASLVYRTMRKMNKVNPEIEVDKYLEGFADSDAIAEYAIEPVAGLIRAKILIGDDTGLLRPCDNMTRAEAAVLLNRLAEFNILISR